MTQPAPGVAPIRRLAASAERVHVLMNNGYGDYGVRNATQLAALLAAAGPASR